MVAYRAAASESSWRVFWVLLSCGDWCGRIKRQIFTCRNSISVVIFWEEWEYLSSHFHFHNLCLLVQVLFQKCHLMWSQNDQIVFLLEGSTVAVLSCCRRMLHKLVQWHHWGCEVQNWSAVTGIPYQIFSSKWPIVGGIHDVNLMGPNCCTGGSDACPLMYGSMPSVHISKAKGAIVL